MAVAEKKNITALEWLKAKAASAEASAKAEGAAGERRESSVIRLPCWPEIVRAVPNGFLRSALFGAVRRGRRRYIDDEQIAALDGIEIYYTGQRLDQVDLDVWMAVVHAVRKQDLGNQCRVTSYALLKLMNKVDTGGNRDVLQKCIMRLRATAIRMKQGRYTYIGGLIDEAYKDEETQEWVIVLNPKLRLLFEVDQFTQVDWAIRHALDGRQLAQWLHGFYASHAKPHPMRIETLLKLAGSENDNPRSANQKLREALGAVAEACAAHGKTFSHAILDGMVHATMSPTPSQARHLIRRALKPKPKPKPKR